MGTTEKESEIILEKYRTRVDALRSKMHFHFFENGKPYSFDYHMKPEFDTLTKELHATFEEKQLSPSPYITNHIPIFLPPQTRRIAFFSYRSKSVREVDINNLETLLEKQAQKRSRAGEFPSEEISKRIKEDLLAFKVYEESHDFDGYRRDILTNTVQFNAYDENDALLIEKSFVRGGLVFNLKPDEFSKIEVTYPRRRKQRSDKKEDYLPLKLVRIRGIHLPEKKSKNL